MLPLRFDELAPFGPFTKAPNEHHGGFRHPSREKAFRTPPASEPHELNHYIATHFAWRRRARPSIESRERANLVRGRELPARQGLIGMIYSDEAHLGIARSRRGRLPARAGPISHGERPGTRYCETRRYPTPRTVSMREACSPSFWRSVRTCMSTVRLPPAKSHPHTCCSSALRERATPGFSMK